MASLVSSAATASWVICLIAFAPGGPVAAADFVQGSMRPSTLGAVTAPVLEPAPSQADRLSTLRRNGLLPDAALPMTNDVPLADYMQALAQVNPAAATGAASFMQAFRAKCGRDLMTMELRAAVAQGRGDPVLMQMIRAAYDHDEGATRRLAALVDCTRASRQGAGEGDAK
jgi:hypothetical protein